VRVLEPLAAGGGLAAEWRAPEPLSLAVHNGGRILAVASRSRLTLLAVQPHTGAVQQLSYIQLSAQLSALTLCSLPPHLIPPPSSSPSPSSLTSSSAEAAAAAAVAGEVGEPAA
ncbi:hypothetical protein Agub_g5667, partial [Astrephomene gubernaculifera]